MTFNILLISLIGFSIVAAGVLAAVYSFTYRNLNKSKISIVSACLLLAIFCIIQILHMQYVLAPNPLMESKLYSTLVLLSAPLYLLFVLEYMGKEIKLQVAMLLHLTPLVINLFIPNVWSLPLSFVIGTAYSLYCVYELHNVRGERARFRFEFICLAFFSVIAGVVLILGVFAHVSEQYFFIGYSLLIAGSFLLVVTSLLLFPEIAINLNEALETRYAKSTLEKVDQNAMLKTLDVLLSDEGLSRNERLNLGMLAERSGFSSHQISELVNSKLGFGVSQYIREHRIRDAKKMLLDEPNASVLSVGLAIGFTSQSTFYAAFNQCVGMSPGKYRNAALKAQLPHS